MGNPNEVSQNTAHDAVMAQMIERTQEMQRQAEAMRNTFETFRDTLTNFNGSIIELKLTVQAINASHNSHLAENKEFFNKFDERLKTVESWKPDIEFVSGIRVKLNKTIATILVSAVLLAIASYSLGGKIHVSL